MLTASVWPTNDVAVGLELESKLGIILGGHKPLPIPCKKEGTSMQVRQPISDCWPYSMIYSLFNIVKCTSPNPPTIPPVVRNVKILLSPLLPELELEELKLELGELEIRLGAELELGPELELELKLELELEVGLEGGVEPSLFKSRDSDIGISAVRGGGGGGDGDESITTFNLLARPSRVVLPVTTNVSHSPVWGLILISSVPSITRYLQH
jgi:hypothetical protein